MLPIGHTVALTYNLKRPLRARQGEDEGRAKGADVPFDFYSEFDSPKTIDAIAEALRVGGHTVHLVEANEDLPRWFLSHEVDVVFNIAEGFGGTHRESQVPAVLEALQVPFTGSSSFTLALALDKAKTKQLLAYDGLPTPAWQLFGSPKDTIRPTLRFPLIVKPNCEGSAKGILRESMVKDEPGLRRQVERVLARYHQPALVEEFIEGVELTVGVLGNEPPKALPILEIDFSGCFSSGEFFYSWRMKEYQGDAQLGLNPAFHCPARLDAKLTAAIHDVAVRAHQLLGCREVSRTDIRLSRDGVPYILEVNPLPGLDPLESNLPIMTTAAGIDHAALINDLVEMAVGRSRQTAQPREPSLARGEPERSVGCGPSKEAWIQ